ncbi:hypothetical protein BJV78DRAFT_745979 [Lactifluus subvellereus]|nr:hypothetical protein BJV78DRAFT_745979 [Lactifluus subvellereus]
MSSTVAHDYDLCPDVKSRLEKRIKDMVAAHGGPVKVIGKPSATGLGVHLIFLSEESPKSTSPRPRPHPRPSTGTPREEEDIEMVESSKSESGSSSDSDMDSSESGSSSDVNTAEWHTPRQQYAKPSSTLDTPKAPRRTEDRQPGNWNEGGLASTDVSVTDSLAPITKRRLAPRSDLKGVEAARRRVEEQRLAEAKKIQLEQLRKRVQREAQQLRQRAADLEREAAEEVARLLQEEIEMDDAGESRDMLEEDGDGDRFDVQSNGSYTPTEVYSDEEEELRWWSPSLSPLPLRLCLRLRRTPPIPTYATDPQPRRRRRRRRRPSSLVLQVCNWGPKCSRPWVPCIGSTPCHWPSRRPRPHLELMRLRRLWWSRDELSTGSTT